jgi:small nuclear ribonucleoprotein (snRNP)-like protein
MIQVMSIFMLTVIQGFDEFMNLVIDDAIEVKQPTKAEPTEKRRPLGTHMFITHSTTLLCIRITNSRSCRSNLVKRRQCVPDTEPFKLKRSTMYGHGRDNSVIIL